MGSKMTDSTANIIGQCELKKIIETCQDNWDPNIIDSRNKFTGHSGNITKTGSVRPILQQVLRNRFR